jgi:hypothetical protein
MIYETHAQICHLDIGQIKCVCGGNGRFSVKLIDGSSRILNFQSKGSRYDTIRTHWSKLKCRVDYVMIKNTD